MQRFKTTSLFRSATAGLAALALCVGLAACGSDQKSANTNNTNDSSDTSDVTLPKIEGLTASGKLGEKPTLNVPKNLKLENQSYAIVQEGDGAVIEDGQRVCYQGVMVKASDGSELMDTWTENQPECSLVVDKDSIGDQLYAIIKGQKLNTTLALGYDDGTNDPYISALTFVSASRDLKRAEGDKVTDVPADLPKVTLDENGKPSIDMNGQGSVDKLIAQPLIKGKGATIGENDTAVVKYTGWLTDGTQFDSSWDKDTTFDASMSGGVIQGWIDGLKGQTVGSQMLLVIPPDLGYGEDGSGSIPANATLVFVVDILAKY